MKLRHAFASLAALMCLGLVFNFPAPAGDKEKKDDKKKEVKKGDKKDLPFDVPKTGPEHKLLAKLAGTFEAKVKMTDPKGGASIDSKGTMKRTVVLDGRYVREDFTGNILGSKFQGMALIGFDVNKKKFVSLWADSMSTGFAMSEGTYDEATKTLTSHGEDNMGGMKVKTKDTLKFVSDDEQHMEMYRSMDGKEFKVMEITFTRAKDMKKKDKKEK